MVDTITYGTIVNIVKNYAKNNCVNITNFSEIPPCYKSGFSFTIGTRDYHITNSRPSTTYHEGATVSGINNPILQVDTSTVDTDMDGFLNAIGILPSQLSYPIDDANFENFLMDMIIFASTKICFAVSQSDNSASSDRRVVYVVANSSFGIIHPIYPKGEGLGEYHIINSTEAQELTNSFFNNVKKSIRVAPITFSFSMW